MQIYAAFVQLYLLFSLFVGSSCHASFSSIYTTCASACIFGIVPAHVLGTSSLCISMTADVVAGFLFAVLAAYGARHTAVLEREHKHSERAAIKSQKLLARQIKIKITKKKQSGRRIRKDSRAGAAGAGAGRKASTVKSGDFFSSITKSFDSRGEEVVNAFKEKGHFEALAPWSIDHQRISIRSKDRKPLAKGSAGSVFKVEVQGIGDKACVGKKMNDLTEELMHSFRDEALYLAGMF